MSGEIQVVYGTTKTLEANGASTANNALSQADDANYDVVSDGGSYPDGEFVLSVTYSVAPVVGSVVAIYARPLDVDGTNDAQAPTAARPVQYIGQMVLENVTTTQYSHPILARDLPKLASYYIHNNATGQTISSGWTLKVTPRSYKPAV